LAQTAKEELPKVSNIVTEEFSMLTSLVLTSVVNFVQLLDRLGE